MNKISRKQFLGKSALGIGSAILAAQFPFKLDAGAFTGSVSMPLGFQVWTIKDKLVKDFPGTLKMMSGLGYRSVEMCSPPGYESSGFGPLMKLSGREMKKIINDAGLSFESTHYGFGEFKNNLDERIEFAQESGQKQMILSSFWLPENAKMDDWLKACDELNEMALKTKKAGIQMGYHNHHMEFAKIDGDLIYDAMLKRLDPGLVKMQFQVAVVNIGYIAADYFKKHPGRFISAHLADWSDKKESAVPIGQGIVDWTAFFAATKTGGVKNIFVEMDEVTFKESAEYLKNL